MNVTKLMDFIILYLDLDLLEDVTVPKEMEIQTNEYNVIYLFQLIYHPSHLKSTCYVRSNMFSILV